MRWQCWLALGLVSFIILTGCATTGEQMASKEKSLYERLGGRPFIEAVVWDFVPRIVRDPRIGRFFANTDLAPLKVKLIDQICEASGGPCKYTGKDMQTAHQGMRITPTDFDALVEDLGFTLDKFVQSKFISAREKAELLAVLGPMRKDIVAP
jgi:hemoglobin